MGDWYVDNRGNWAYDENAPTPSVEATQLQPAVAPEPQRPDVVDTFQRPEGTYLRIDPGWFDSFDEVDSRTVVDDGGPPDAA